MRIAIGIPSFQEADTIANVVRQVDEGLVRLADPRDCQIVNADGESPDGTSEVFRQTATRCGKHSIVTSDHDGKGSNVFNIFRYCREQGVEALALVDADLSSVTPDWVGALLGPIIGGAADYIAPVYLRRRYEGASTNHFAYPLFSAWFGSRMRQPIGGEFGLAAGLIDYLLEQPVNREIRGYGIDIFMSIHAAGGGFRIGQAQLGRKQHKLSFPKTPRIFPEMATAALMVVRRYGINERQDEAAEADPAIDDTQGQLDQRDTAAVLDASLPRIAELMPVYEKWLGAGNARAGQMAAGIAGKKPRISAEVWAELAAGCVVEGVEGSTHEDLRTLADQLFPAWRVRMISFADDNHLSSPAEIEAEIEHQRRHFTASLRDRMRGRRETAEYAKLTE